MQLRNKRILLGVCGSIAAYKSVFLTRLLVKEGAEVRVIMTPDARAFVGPLSFATLSRNPVEMEYFNSNTGVWANHVALAEWGDMLLLAPATANTLAKLRAGLCDNLLMAVYLSARCPVAIAPAMDLEMYRHTATRENLDMLRKRGHLIMDAKDGELASGLHGQGRMAEPEHIVEELKSFFNQPGPLSGRRVLVNAGPTYEHIDPVRFIGNHSSGKMGLAIASAFQEHGAGVDLVLGPVAQDLPIPAGLSVHHVVSADEMYKKCLELFPSCDVAVLSAAVADYKPIHFSETKIKKTEDTLELRLERTRDILRTLGQQKGKRLLIGFALETENELANAKAKLTGKNADLIVLNSLNDPGAGFGHNTNRVHFVTEEGNESLDLMEKTELGRHIARFAAHKLEKRL